MKYRVILLALLGLSFAQLDVDAQQSKSGVQLVRTDRPPIRYVIVHNEIDPKLSPEDDDRRVVEILVEKEGFSKEGLTDVLKIVSRRFSKPASLYVNAYTSLDDVSTPEERDQGAISGSRNGNSRKGDYAVFVRTRKKIFFYMYYSDGRFEEVELK